MASLSSPGRSQAQARTYIPQIHHPRAWARVMILAPTTTSKLSNELVFLQRKSIEDVSLHFPMSGVIFGT
jgi:hypothetical protein